MEGDFINVLRTILELGWPGIVLVMVVLVWRAYQERVREHIADLREIAGLKARLERLESAIPTQYERASASKARASRPSYN